MAYSPSWRSPTSVGSGRLCQAGETGPAFTLTTQPLPPGDPQRAEAVRTDARRRNGCEREQVEALLADRQTRPWQGRQT